MAGYVALRRQWVSFENKANLLFDQYGVKLLHGKDFHHNKFEFRNWTINKKLSFVRKLCALYERHVLLGIVAGTHKARFITRKQETGLVPNESAYGFCFRSIIFHLIGEDALSSEIAHHGISFRIESGNKNNPDVMRVFERARMDALPKHALRSISLVGKESCVAIQAADFLAFHSRRWAVECHEAGEVIPANKPEIVRMLERSSKHIGRIANAFGPG